MARVSRSNHNPRLVFVRKPNVDNAPVVAKHRHARPGPVIAGFSLVELVVVVVIIGIVAAIAVPRLTGASEQSQSVTCEANLAMLYKASEHYKAEHDGRTVAHNDDWTIATNGARIVFRLTQQTEIDGTPVGSNNVMAFGPYLREIPANPWSGLRTVRIDGVAAGNGSAGWRYDSATETWAADNSSWAAQIQPGLVRLLRKRIADGTATNAERELAENVLGR